MGPQKALGRAVGAWARFPVGKGGSGKQGPVARPVAFAPRAQGCVYAREGAPGGRFRNVSETHRQPDPAGRRGDQPVIEVGVKWGVGVDG